MLNRAEEMKVAIAILLISSPLVSKKSPACWTKVKTVRWSAPHLHFDKITFFPAFALPWLIVQPWPVEMEPRNHASGSAMWGSERESKEWPQRVRISSCYRLTLHISRKSSSDKVQSIHATGHGQETVTQYCSLALHCNAWAPEKKPPPHNQYNGYTTLIDSFIHLL